MSLILETIVSLKNVILTPHIGGYSKEIRSKMEQEALNKIDELLNEKNVIFDFDGVILNSHKVETDGFYELFKKYGKTIGEKSKKFI